jgi:hypothetical protein
METTTIGTNGGAKIIDSHHTTTMCDYISKERFGLKGKASCRSVSYREVREWSILVLSWPPKQ